METHTLFSLNEYIRRVLALNFPEALWVRCEISQVSWSRGHAYLKLMQKAEEGEDIIAQGDAVCWARTYRSLVRKHGEQLGALLQDGMEVRLKVSVSFHERYGLKLQVEDIDPAFTLGQLEARRRQILEQLSRENLLDLNAEIPLPEVVQRIAVLSGEQAAGWHDFRAHLANNNHGYAFHLQLFPTALQGDRVEVEMSRQLEIISKKVKDFDAVVLIRGGGARLDLASFDSLVLALKVAHMPLPFLTGIGHEIDLTVLDRVAHSHLKTPTAVADFLISHNFNFEAQLDHLATHLLRQSESLLRQHGSTLDSLEHGLQFAAKNCLQQQEAQLLWLANSLPSIAIHPIQRAESRLDKLEALMQNLDPNTILKRGFTLTSSNGKILRSGKSLQPGDTITTRFHDGHTESKILPES